MKSTPIRLAGAFGIASVLLVLPAYVVGMPDLAGSETVSYFGSVGWFVVANGVFPLLSIVLFLLFLSGLGRLSQQALPSSPCPTAVVVGGSVYAAVSLVGVAAEVAYPAAVDRFGAGAIDPSFSLVLLTLSGWLYHLAQLGVAVMAFGFGITVWQSRVYPAWLAVLAWVVAVLALLHFLIPLPAVIAGMLFMLVAGTFMILRPLGAAGVLRTT